MFQVHFSLLYDHSSNTSSRNMSWWRLVYVHCRGAYYGFTNISTFSSGTPPFLRTFSLSGAMPTLVMMHVPGTISLVRVHGTTCFTWLLSWVGLIDWLCCSQEDICREGMDSGCLNCAGKDVSFKALQTVFMGHLCFCVNTWICVHSCLIHQ